MNAVWRHGRPASRQCAFTLIELLVVMAILALLMAIASAGLASARAASRKVMCMNQLRDVIFRFSEFADPASHPNRGDSERYGPKIFRLEDFQESLYRIDEFWDGGDATDTPCDPVSSRLICPSISQVLTKHKGLPCSQYAVTPSREISIGFNMRLEYVSLPASGRLKRVPLTSQIRERSWVPLAMDVDGAQADEHGAVPYETAPPAGDTGLYGTGQFWFASSRHAGKCNVGFVGGHVLGVAAPEKSGGAQWSYQPPVN